MCNSLRRKMPVLAAVFGFVLLSGCGAEDDAAIVGEAPLLGIPAEGVDAGGEGRWWQPTVTDSWQWQLEGELNLGYEVEVYDVDLFDTEAATIDELKGAGRRVICYFSAGSREDWRDDAKGFAPAAVGTTLDGWEDERWVDVTHPSVREVMAERLDVAVNKGCDGVEPDNVDAHDNETGFSFSRDDQLAFNTWMAAQAHDRGLAVGLKNALGLIPDLVDHYDFAVNEECWAYEECGALIPFISAGKPVFHVEYQTNFITDGGCAEMKALGFQSMLLPLDLDDSFRSPC